MRTSNEVGVSFVVPTKNSERTLAACLRSIKAQTGTNVELLVVDNASTDRTPQIAAELADAVLEVGPERCAQRNAGSAAARFDLIVFIDSDMVVDPDIATQVVAAFQDDSLQALVLPELAFGEGFFARCRSWEKQLYIGDRSVEAARAFRRSSLHACGGWNEALTAAEDWDLTDRVVAAFGPSAVGRTMSYVHHDEGRIRLRETFAKKTYYGQWIPTYRAGATARRLVRPSLLRPAVLTRPHLSAGLVLLKAVEWAGILRGSRRAQRSSRTAGSSGTS